MSEAMLPERGACEGAPVRAGAYEAAPPGARAYGGSPECARPDGAPPAAERPADSTPGRAQPGQAPARGTRTADGTPDRTPSADDSPGYARPADTPPKETRSAVGAGTRPAPAAPAARRRRHTPGLARAAGATAALTAAGAILGLLRDQAVARLFGAGPASDAFLVAWTVPEVAATVLIEDAMALVMVPAFSGVPARGGDVRTLVRGTLPWLLAVLAVLTAALAAGAPAVVRALAPGLADPATAVACTRLTALTLFTFGLAGYLSAALRAYGRFLAPAAIYVAYNLGILATLLALHGRWGVRAAALGVAVGGALMVAVQLPAVTAELRVRAHVRRTRPSAVAPLGVPAHSPDVPTPATGTGPHVPTPTGDPRTPAAEPEQWLMPPGTPRTPTPEQRLTATGTPHTATPEQQLTPTNTPPAPTPEQQLTPTNTPPPPTPEQRLSAVTPQAPAAEPHETRPIPGQPPLSARDLRTSVTEPGHRAPAATPEAALLALLAPVLLFTLGRQAQVLVERFFAAPLSAGAISHLNYAQKVAQLPMALSLMTCAVTFPVVSRALAAGEREQARRRVERDLTLACVVVLVGSAYVIACAPQIIETLFQRGEFDAGDTAATATVMRVYALGLLGQSLVGALVRPYFSAGRPTWGPAAAMAVGLLVTGGVDAAVVGTWGVYGIAAGNAAGITVTAALLLRGLGSHGIAPRARAMAARLGLLLCAAAAATGAGWALAERIDGALTAAGACALAVPAVFAGIAGTAAAVITAASPAAHRTPRARATDRTTANQATTASRTTDRTTANQATTASRPTDRTTANRTTDPTPTARATDPNPADQPSHPAPTARATVRTAARRASGPHRETEPRP